MIQHIQCRKVAGRKGLWPTALFSISQCPEAVVLVQSREWEKRDPPVKPRATFLISGTCFLVDKVPKPQQRPDLVRESKGDREGQLV